MPTLIRFPLAMLVLVVHVLSASPVLAVADLATRGATGGSEERCPGDCGTDAEPSEDSGECCPDGCELCPLSCCSSVPAVLGERLIEPAPSATSPAYVPRASTRLPSSDPRAITHPPRA